MIAIIVSLLFSFFLTALSPVPAEASSELMLALLCQRADNCSEKERKTQQQLEWNCQLEVKAQNCEQLAQEHPDWAPLMRKCDFKSQCAEQWDLVKEKASACLRGYKNAMIDLGLSLKDMSVSLAGFVEDSWENFKKNNAQRTAFLKECNKTIVCKRDLVRDDHRYNTLSDQELAKLPATFLYVQAQDMKAYKASLDRVRPKPYVPISERARDDVTLTSEQNQKLQSLLNLAGDKIKEQYNRYSCYHAVAREELQCYALGTVIDPTLVAGYFVKGARLAGAAGRLGKELEATATAAKVSKVVTRAELTGKYLSYSPTTVVQNEKWIALAEKGADSKRLFLDVENSQMKYLNDSLKDKNLVTGLTNYHKEILFGKIAELEKANPGLVIDPYSDFKSSRFALSGKIPKDIDAQLAKAVAAANQEFNEAVKAAGVVGGDAKSAEWFRAGTGQSADQANLAARYSRQLETNEVQSYQSGSLQRNVESRLSGIESQRVSLRTELAKTDMVQGETFHQDVFDIVRKSKGNTELAREALKNRFALQNLSSESVKKLESYVSATDEFSPGIYVAKREVAHLNDAPQGGLSADIIGLGSANLKGTAEALAKGGSLSKTLEQTRLAEKAVTEKFVAQKKYFEEVIRDAVGADKLKSICSGDDCVAVATSPLTAQEKQKIMSGLAASEYSGSYRLAFIPDGVKVAETRNALANHGESVEKILRQTLSTSLEPRKLKGLTFGVDMKTQSLNEGGVKLIIGEAQSARLTPNERKMIQQKFQEAISQFNKETKGSRYEALP